MIYYYYMKHYSIKIFFVISVAVFFAVGPYIIEAPRALAATSAEEAQDEYDKTQKKLKKELADLKALEQSLGQINSSLTATQQLIQRTQVMLNQTAQTIDQKELEISNLENQLRLEKKVLAHLLQEMYASGTSPLVEVMLTRDDIGDFFQGHDNLFSTQEKMQGVIGEINDMKVRVVDEKWSLEDTKKDHEELLQIKNKQKHVLVANKMDVQEDVADQEATVSELQAKLVELQGDLNKLTGKSYNAKDIRDAVEYASGKVGVPKGVLYGFLKMETNLGANTGQCTYSEVEKVSISRYKKYGSKYKNSIALLYRRQALFYDLVEKLDYSKSKKVSCSPAYLGQGGAMGVSQFMSDVWNSYSAEVASRTGHGVPDPWNLTDGVMAMALKLKKAGATSDSPSAIKKASIAYLGGYNANYYNGIVYWSKNYKKLFS